MVILIKIHMSWTRKISLYNNNFSDNLFAVCKLLSEGVTTIIGPMTSTSVKASHPMCLGFHMPMISPSATDPMLDDAQGYKYLLRMTPPDSQQSHALVDLIKYFRWDTMAILTDNTDYGECHRGCLGVVVLTDYGKSHQGDAWGGGP